MSEKDLILLSVKDFFTKQMLKYSLAPFILTIVVMYILFFVVVGAQLDVALILKSGMVAIALATMASLRFRVSS